MKIDFSYNIEQSKFPKEKWEKLWFEVKRDVEVEGDDKFKDDFLANNNQNFQRKNGKNCGLKLRLLHQDKCRIKPVKAAVNDSSIMSPSTPPSTDLNLAEESCSTWLDYVGPVITDELETLMGMFKGRSLSRNYIRGKIIFLAILRFGVIMAT
ncbi:hypothetical protein CTI12_AA506160 [Artemisia annua]|uniref:Uncharacterized protein n=1 Tax=Artemisia annua TaxID=35608 RepID=A0A2U1LCE9_ARTAN|nr:hypothetical protein CTI12_AA506160 [Artemisia annua]